MRTEDIFLVISSGAILFSLVAIAAILASTRGAYAAQNPCLDPYLTPVTAVSTVTAVTGRADTLKASRFRTLTSRRNPTRPSS